MIDNVSADSLKVLIGQLVTAISSASKTEERHREAWATLAETLGRVIDHVGVGPGISAELRSIPQELKNSAIVLLSASLPNVRFEIEAGAQGGPPVSTLWDASPADAPGTSRSEISFSEDGLREFLTRHRRATGG